LEQLAMPSVGEFAIQTRPLYVLLQFLSRSLAPALAVLQLSAATVGKTAG